MNADQLKLDLAPALARIFPTAQTIVLHERLVRERGLPHLEDHLFAYDAQGRPLLPLRPLELPELHDALRQTYGGGYVVVQAPDILPVP